MGAYADVVDPLAQLSADDTNQASGDALKAAIEDAGWQVQAVNWLYEQVTGQNLVEALIAPLTGDFAKIEQNAAAWQKISDALRGIRENLNNGISELRETWEGAGAAAFETGLVFSWTVALEADAGLARLISSGFQKAAEGSRRLCDKALELIQKLVDRLIEIGATGWIPIAGWANVARNVMKCVDIVSTVLGLIEALKGLYDSVVNLINSVISAGTSLAKIKDVRSLGDAVNLGIEIGEKATEVTDAATGVRDSVDQVRQSARDTKNAFSGNSDNGDGGDSGDGSGGGSDSSGGSSSSSSSDSSSSSSNSGESFGYRTAMSGTL